MELSLKVMDCPLQILMTPPTIGGEVLKLIVYEEGGFLVTLDVQESSIPGGAQTYHVTTVVPTGKPREHCSR